MSAVSFGTTARSTRPRHDGAGGACSSRASSPASVRASSASATTTLADLLAQPRGDVQRQGADGGILDAPRPGDVDGELLRDPAGTAGEEQHAIAEAHRLAHVVGD